MINTRVLETSSRAPVPSDRQRRGVHIADFLLPLSVALWAVALLRAQVPSSPPNGLLSYLPLIFYAALALLLVSAVVELSQSPVSQRRMAVHAVTLVVMLYATAPLVYPEGRYGWLYKTIGVVQYINDNGQLNSQIDIYQNWPGFFALASWFDKIAGVGSPLAYVKWAQPFFELAAIPLLYLIYDALRLTVRQCWVAVLLFIAANWISQDYFSPQALGMVLSLGIMAMAMRWLYSAQPDARRRRAPQHSDGDGPSSSRLRWWSFPEQLSRKHSVLVCGAIIGIFFVLTMTHQLSPYIVVIQLGALSAARMLRPRWLPLALLAIAIAYLVPRFSFVSTHYGLLQTIGSLFGNASPPSLAGGLGAVSAGEKMIERCSELLSLGVWFLAFLGAWLRRRSGRPALSLLLLAFSPALVLALESYGNEGILRVYLFSLPWSAGLAACALAPLPTGKPSRVIARLFPPADRPQGALRVFGALAVAAALFLPSFYGDDGYNVMSKAEVATLTTFQNVAPAGTIFVGLPNGPFHDTSRYDEFPILSIFGPDGFIQGTSVRPDVGLQVLHRALATTSRSRPVYVIITPDMAYYNNYYGVAPPDALTVLARSMARTPPWILVAHAQGTEIYELPPWTLPVGGHGQPAVPAGRR